MGLFSSEEDLDADAAQAQFAAILDSVDTDPENLKIAKRLFLKEYAKQYIYWKETFSDSKNWTRPDDVYEYSFLKITIVNKFFELFDTWLQTVEQLPKNKYVHINQRAINIGYLLGMYFAFFEYAIVSPYASFHKRATEYQEEPSLNQDVLNHLVVTTKIFACAMHSVGKPVSLSFVAKRLQRIVNRNARTLNPAQREILLALAKCFMR